MQVHGIRLIHVVQPPIYTLGYSCTTDQANDAPPVH